MNAGEPPMRILLVSDSYPPLIGGATRSAQQLARQLARRDHAVTVVTAWQPNVPTLDVEPEGVRVHRVRGLTTRVPGARSDPHRSTPAPFPDPEAIWRVRRIVREFRPDVVHSYGWLTYSAAVALVGSRVPLVLSARDYAYVCAVRTLVRQGRDEGDTCSGPALGKCLECAGAYYGRAKGAVAVTGVLGVRPLLRRRVAGVHSVSRYVEQVMDEHVLGDRDVPHDIVASFREDDSHQPGDPAFLQRLPAEPFILFVGALRRIKGVEVLLAAYERLDEPRPPLVVIGGRAPEAPTFPDNVTVLYDVPHDTVMAAWQRSLFGVAPSLWPEPLGNVVHEAMSCGKAVVGTRPGGHEDMIVDGETGFLVPAGDVEGLAGALGRLSTDPGLRERMGAAGRQRAGLFTAEAALPRFEALFRKAIAAGSR